MLPFNSAKPSCILSLLFIFSREVPEVSRLYAISQCNRFEPVADVCVLHMGASGRSVMTQRHPKSFLCGQLAGACLLLVTGGHTESEHLLTVGCPYEGSHRGVGGALSGDPEHV